MMGKSTLLRIATAVFFTLVLVLQVGCSSNVTNGENQNEQEDWQTYSSEVFHVTFKYPGNWQEERGYQTRYAGKDGFVQLDAMSGKGWTLDEVSEGQSQHKLKPYGTQPETVSLQVDGREARLILPSTDQPEGMKGHSALIVQSPEVIEISGERYFHLILYADQEHIRDIVETIKFLPTS